MATRTATAKKKPATRKKAPVRAPAVEQVAARPRSDAAAKAKATASGKADKPKKAKLVRDSFTMPKTEHAVLDELKLRAAKLGRPAKKSEVLRAGVQALAGMGDAAFLAAVGGVPAIKTGRPAKA
jgi:hypothetical protein